VSSTLAQVVPDSRHRRIPATAPAVAVSATSDAALGPHRVRLNSAYIKALEIAGVVPVIVPPLSDDASVSVILSRVDGVLLTGGEDVEPSLYGQPRIEQCGPSNSARDATEIALVRGARDMRKPLLAICRGPQLLNVALGGTLYQDIPSQVPGALEHNEKEERASRVHPVEVEPGSRLADAVRATSLSVNSLHHQSVRDVAPALRVTALAPDGVVEGLETPGEDWWVLAVQWHPEEMTDSPESPDRGIFKAFADRLREG
jgi:putative glutamine amidotransferase